MKDLHDLKEIRMIPNRNVSWYVVAAMVMGIVFVGAGCGSESGGMTDGGGGAAGGAGNSGAAGVGGSGAGGTAGTSMGSGGLGGRGGGPGGGRGGAAGTGGRGTGGITVPDGGINLDAFNFDAFNLDAIGIDSSAVPACAASVSDGAACTMGTDTVCRPTGGTVCLCLRGIWSCG
jgi:hypothetical protein